MHRDLEACFPPGLLHRVFSFLSVTELTEYMPTEEDDRRQLVEQENLSPDSRRLSDAHGRIARAHASNTSTTAFTPRCPIGRSWPFTR